MPKYRCTVCEYVEESEQVPEICIVCGVTSERFEEVKEKQTNTEKDLIANWDTETEEVGLYLAYAKKAEEEGYPEIAQAWIKIALEEGYHAAEIYEVLGKVKSTKENLKARIEAERAAEKAKLAAAEKAIEKGNKDAANFFYRASKDEGRHASIFEGLLKRFF